MANRPESELNEHAKSTIVRQNPLSVSRADLKCWTDLFDAVQQYVPGDWYVDFHDVVYPLVTMCVEPGHEGCSVGQAMGSTPPENENENEELFWTNGHGKTHTPGRQRSIALFVAAMHGAFPRMLHAILNERYHTTLLGQKAKEAHSMLQEQLLVVPAGNSHDALKNVYFQDTEVMANVAMLLREIEHDDISPPTLAEQEQEQELPAHVLLEALNKLRSLQKLDAATSNAYDRTQLAEVVKLLEDLSDQQ